MPRRSPDAPLLPVTRAGRRSKLPAARVLLPLVAFSLLAWRFDFLCDDAHISFRYSKHLAEGHGLRYNLGESPPVEGYSNFLWVVWLGALHRLGLDITVWSRLCSVACGATLVLWVTHHARRRFELSEPAAVATGVFLATLPPIALWATSGLATMPLTLFVFGCYERLLGDPGRSRGAQAALFAVLAALVRADGAVWILMLLAAAGLSWLVQGRPRPLLRAALVTGGALALTVTAHVAWRLSYYGELVPHTARIKGGFHVFRLERGLLYVSAFFLGLPGIALVLLTGLRRWERGLRGVWIPVGLLIGGALAYSVWVGGDFMPMGRFLMPALPLVALVLAAAWRAFPAALAGTMTLVCVSLSLLGAFDLNPVPDPVYRRLRNRFSRRSETEVEVWRGMQQRAEAWALQGKALAHCTQPAESLILGAIGAQGYYSELTIYDTYGLVSPSVIEHGKRSKGNAPGHDLGVEPEFFFDRHPTYLGSVLVPAGSPELEGLPKAWPRLAWKDLVTVEACPLPESAGFPPGLELRLLRFHRWE